MNRKIVSTGLLAGLIAGTGAGLIMQQSGFAGASALSAVAVEDGTPTPTVDATTDTDTDTATDTGATDTGRPDHSDRLREVLQPLVDDGTLTADQLEAVVAALAEAGPSAGGRGGHDGHGGPGDHGGPLGGGRGGHGVGLDAAATALGITADELRTQLEAGSTIAEVATTEGVDIQTVIDALVTEAKARLAEAVTAGDLTQEQADARLAEITTRITELVNTGRPARPDRPEVDPATDSSVDTSVATS
jgi:polyhydroxyalkanoate synthesis regulator phasin